MRTAVIAFLCAIGLAPVAASGVIFVDVARVDIVPNGLDQVVLVDVWLRSEFDTTDEKLDAFTIAINGPRMEQNGVRFLPPVRLPSNAHPYVFRDFPGIEPADFGSTFNQMQVGAATTGLGQTADISASRSGLFAIPVLVPRDIQGSIYPMIVDPGMLSLSGAAGPIIAVPGFPGGFYRPEPTALGLLPLGVLALARTRRPARRPSGGQRGNRASRS